jgi:putative transposase
LSDAKSLLFFDSGKDITSTERSALKKLTPLGKAFRDFFISYAKSFNKRYGRSGSLFQYKFQRKPVEDNDYLRRLVVYIHNNPVRSALCRKPAEWDFSSYTVILGTGPTAIKRDDVLDWFGGREVFIAYHQQYTNQDLKEMDLD